MDALCMYFSNRVVALVCGPLTRLCLFVSLCIYSWAVSSKSLRAIQFCDGIGGKLKVAIHPSNHSTTTILSYTFLGTCCTCFSKELDAFDCVFFSGWRETVTSQYLLHCTLLYNRKSLWIIDMWMHSNSFSWHKLILISNRLPND